MSLYPKTIPITGRVRVCVNLLKQQSIKNKVIVDVGSTFGWLFREVASEKPKKYIGIEPNKSAVAFSQKNNPKATFIEGVAGNLPVTKNIADIVVFFDVIEHIPSNTEKDALLEINRVLKKDGVLLLTTPFDHPVTKLVDPAWYFGHRHYSKELMRKLLQDAGFKVKDIQVKGTTLNLIYMIIFYFNKWVLRSKKLPKFLTDIDDREYKKDGIATLCVIAIKK